MMKKKIIYILILFVTVLCLNACSSQSVLENGEIDATTNITWSGEKKKIVVSTVTIKCNDNYYGVVVNDSINFNNDNNYFTTGEGLTISIKDTEEPIGNGTYNYKARIEDNAYLLVSGNDEDKVKEVFNNVFKTNKESYQMFSHDISSDWTQNVIITSDVVSFSNGSDTTYIYQNDGSLSEGCLDGKIEPTVFKKQLRGIDIPITYPEDIEGVSNYIPYGSTEYNHWTNKGYTPYSAYTISIEFWDETLYNEKSFSYYTVTHDNSDDMANFIILANNDNNVLNLFEERNNHTQVLYSLKPKSYKVSNIASNIIKEDLSNVKEIATSVINSENRYHFGVLSATDTYLTPWTKSNTSGYYIDNYTCLDVDFKIAGGMNGKIVIPTIKYALPTYLERNESLEKYGTSTNESKSVSELAPYSFMYASEATPSGFASSGRNFEFSNHGAYISFDGMMTTNDRLTLGWHNYILEGDYMYFYDDNNSLYIFKNIATETRVEEDENLTNHLPTYITYENTVIKRLVNDFSYTESCFGDALDNLNQVFVIESLMKY